jgi:hypothetical protein
VAAAGLADIDEKLQAGERLTLEDGVRLFDAPDQLAVGWLANREREKRHGARPHRLHRSASSYPGARAAASNRSICGVRWHAPMH